MTDFEKLCAVNRHIVIHKVTEAVFKPYGRVLTFMKIQLNFPSTVFKEKARLPRGVYPELCERPQ